MSFRSEANIETQSPDSLMNKLLSLIKSEHGMEFDKDTDGSRFVASAGFRISFRATENIFMIELSGPNPEREVFFRNELERLLREINPAILTNFSWDNATL